MIPADKKIERMLNVAHMYYERDMTQNQIAKELGISRPLVSLLLTEARSCGLVTITINDVQSREQLAAKQMESTFGLGRALVEPDAASADATDNGVALAAFCLCFEEGAENIGIGWGSMMGRMADWAEPEKGDGHKSACLFPLIGGIGASYRGYHTNELTRIISGKLGCQADYLYFPAFFDSEQELATRALEVGSDVPYCLRGGTMLAEGIGEELRPLAPMPHCWVVLCKPPFAVSTKDVYREMDEIDIRKRPDTAGMIKALEKDDYSGVCRRLSNVMGLVTATKRRQIGEIKAFLTENGADGTLMSGSGPTVYGLFSDESRARTAAKMLSRRFADTFLTETV